VKSIEACLELYNDKDHHTNSDSNSHSGDVDNRIIQVTDQTSESGFEIVSKHACLLYNREIDFKKKRKLLCC
jgi:hypothetical protein